ncbi:MAG: PAS domain S-box protein [Deltaproteobacteria bacterium]|nr:PAS domain S-box protein [Deltaproteobacteria bacterium]
MATKPTYEELEQKVKELHQESIRRKLVEEALRESEIRYRTLFEASADGILITDFETRRYMYANPTLCKMLGYSEQEIKKLTIADLHPKDKLDYVVSQFETKAKEKAGFAGDIPFLKKDGKIIHMDIAGTTATVDGKSCSVAFLRDITERKRTEEALRESEERYKRLWNDAPVAYHRLDTRGIIKQVNQTELDMLGYTKEEMEGKPVFDFILPEQRKGAQERYRLKIAGEQIPRHDSKIYIRKDGSEIFVFIDDRLERDSDGKVIGVRTTMVDVSEQKRTEMALRESEKKYSILVENSLTGIYIDQDEKIVFANNRFAEIYGYPMEELIGMDTWRLVHPEDRPLTNRTRARRLKGESVPSEYLARGMTKAGETIWIARRNVLIEYQGRPAILGNIVDISQQKHAEEELRKTNEELKNFVNVVSHDLKTPIISIQGFSARLRKNYQEKLGEKGRRYISQIETSARRMEALVSDLLELSRIGRVVSAFSDVSSIEIVKNATAGLQDRLKDRGIKLAVAENLPRIHCDGERIYQVFENLIVNAIKFMGDSENPKIEIGYEDKGAFHQFHVRDNGIGIDPKWHRKVFDIFHRLKEIEDQEGTGLGLAILYRIVSNHGGKVWVESEKGKGATFYFTLAKLHLRR